MLEDFEKIILEDVLILKVNLPNLSLVEAKEFRDSLQNDINQEHNNIIVDLSDCIIVDSAFIGVIVQAQRMLLQNQGELKLVLPAEQTEGFFKFVGITRVIDTYHSLEDAISSFNNKSEKRVNSNYPVIA
jgi:anti-anti-sigma factor